MVVYTNAGCSVVLADAGSSGSEGVVYDVVDDPCSVAKIYHADDPDMFIHEVKVEAMASTTSLDAWACGAHNATTIVAAISTFFHVLQKNIHTPH